MCEVVMNAFILFQESGRADRYASGDMILANMCEAYTNVSHQTMECDYDVPYEHTQSALLTIPPAKRGGESHDHLYEHMRSVPTATPTAKGGGESHDHSYKHMRSVPIAIPTAKRGGESHDHSYEHMRSVPIAIPTAKSGEEHLYDFIPGDPQ